MLVYRISSYLNVLVVRILRYWIIGCYSKCTRCDADLQVVIEYEWRHKFCRKCMISFIDVRWENCPVCKKTRVVCDGILENSKNVEYLEMGW
jgi:hypothetical protein